MNIKDLIKNNVVKFEFYRAGVMFYNVEFEGKKYRFPVSLDDIGSATLNCQEKAMLFMRWIRKAIDNNEIHEIN